MACTAGDGPGRLAGKAVLVTGAAGGQGRVAVEVFASEGANVIATDVVDELDDPTRATFDRVGATYLAADLTVEHEVARVVDTISAHGVELDALYCNHAITQQVEPVLETSTEKFDRLFSVNMRSLFLVNRYVAAGMAQRGRGSIVNIASVAAIRANAGIAPYSATKAAVVHFSRILAIELAERDVRVNVICPGLIDTPMATSPTEHLPPDERDRIDRMMRDSIPLHRIGAPSEVVWAGVYLASDESSYTTGAVIAVDGGVGAR